MPENSAVFTSKLACNNIYVEHKPWLQRWLFNKLGCNQDAADLAQDTFVRLLARNKENIAEPKAYLRVIANGLLIDQYRRRSIESAYLEALKQMPQNVQISAEETELMLETLHHIDAALSELPPQVSQAFFLSQLHGLTYQQIADKQAVSLRTIKRYMQKAYLTCLTVML